MTCHLLVSHPFCTMASRKPSSRAAFGSLLSRAARQWRRAADLRLQPFELTEAPWLPPLITFSGTLAMNIFVPALPEAARDLGASIGAMQLTMSVYILGLAVGQLAYGPLSDRFGRRPVLMAGLVLYAVGGIAAAI